MQVKTTQRPPGEQRDVNWRQLGACREADPELFFPEKPDARSKELQAIGVCMTCPVVGRCQQWALATQEQFGVWGGLTEKDRRRIWNRRAAAVRAGAKPPRRERGRRRPGRAA